MLTTRRTNKYSVTYDEYVTSKMNQNNHEFFNKDGNFTITAEYTLEQKIDFMISENILELDMELIKWYKKGMDQPINLSEDVYRAFIAYFYNWQINQQTIDLHKVKLKGFFSSRKYQLISRLMAYTQYQLSDISENEASANGGTTTTVTTAAAESTVPENQVDIDLGNPKMEYADNLGKSKQDTTVKNNGTNTKTNTVTKDKDLFKYIGLGSELQFLFNEAISPCDLFM